MERGRRGALPLDPAKGLPLEPSPEDWDAPLKAPRTPVFHLDGFEGPMDLLLDLAERQRIDLGRISIVDLAGQFVAECEGRLRDLPVERRADWLVMAARLLLLRSRLLLPSNPGDAAAARREAAAELTLLEQAAHMRAAATWLSAQPQLGIDVFGRPRRGPDPRTASYFALMEACLAVLRGPHWRDEPVPVYRPATPHWWRVSDALARIRAVLAERPEGGGLEAFLPAVAAGPDFELKARAAVASSFGAALELCHTGEAAVWQDRADILVAAEPPCGTRRLDSAR